MSGGDVPDRVRAVMGDVFGVPEERLREATGRGELAEWDSIGHLRMVTVLEEEFSVRLSMEEIGEIDSVGSVVAAVQRHL